MEDINTYDVLQLAGLLERAWAERDAALSDVERQSWDLIETMILHEPTVQSLTCQLRKSAGFSRKGSFRMAVKVMLTYVEEIKVNDRARVGV